MAKLVQPWRLAAATVAVAMAASGAAVGAVTQASASSGAPYPCTTSNNANFQSATGPGVDVSAIGWLGNNEGAVACLGGSFFVQNGIDTTYGFGVYNDSPTTWTNADGYLPALVTGFTSAGAKVSITNFGDRVVIGGHPFVLIYSRVTVHNPTSQTVTVDPQPSPGLVPLNSSPDQVSPGATVDHDYVVAADRFGGTYAWPTAAQLAAAGPYNAHFNHMRAFWNEQLAGITQLALPDQQLVDAYKAGFAYTQIDRSGNALDTGTNGYHAEYEHDVIGILANMFNEGYFTGAHALLDETDHVVGTNTQYSDGTWVYPWLWALYVEKTGDTKFLAQRFSSPGPQGASAQPSIEATAQIIAADRTGPGGIIGETSDIDANGYWVSDNYEALLGLAGYEYLAKVMGNPAQETWAAGEYSSLLAAVNSTLSSTISSNNLNYIPCSMLEPNTANRCSNPEDANWAAPGVYFNWAWNASMLGVPTTSPNGGTAADWIDKTLSYGFGRLNGLLPANTFGGYPGEGFWSTAYNGAYGAWGLDSNNYRDEGILSLEFLIKNDQAGPYSWWEGSTPPSTTTPWIGNHPAGAGGASPHSWGIAMGDLGLLDSFASQRTDGGLIVGRGVPNSWVASGQRIAMSNFPTIDGHRIGVAIATRGDAVTLKLTGKLPGPVTFELPAFVNNIASASAGTIDNGAGTVTVSAHTRSVTVTLAHAPAS